MAESNEKGSLGFFRTLERAFGRRFLGYLLLSYLGLKGVANTLVDASLLPYFQKMGVSGTEFQLAQVVARIPWSMKGFMGVLSDCLPLGRYHKRGYLLASSIVGMIGLAVLATIHPNHDQIWNVANLFCLVYFLISTFDLLCEGKYSEIMRKEAVGSEVLTLVWSCVQLGSLAASFVVGIFIDTQGPQPLLLACLPIAVVAAWRTAEGDVPEEKARSWKSLMLKARSEPGLFGLALAMAAGSFATAVFAAWLGKTARTVASVLVSGVLVWFSFKALPRAIASCNFYMFLVSTAYLDMTGVLAYWYTGGPNCVPDGPHFSYSYYLAVSNVVGSAGAVIGAVLFQNMQHWTFRGAFCVTTFIQVLAALFDLLLISRLNLRLGLPDQAVYLFGDAACQNMAQQMALMPMALLTARLCPRGAEATVFAILAGFQNFGMSVSSILGVLLTESFGIRATSTGEVGSCEFDGLSETLIIGHCIIPLACLPLTWVLVPSTRMDDENAFSGAPPPSFASPPNSPPTSPRGGGFNYADLGFGEVQEDYHVLHEDADPDGFRLTAQTT